MAINHKDLRTAVIRPDGGMDCTSVAAQVPASRASTMVNFEPRRGLNQKRHGWEQVSRVQVPVTDEYGVTVGFEHPAVNGMWTMKLAGGETLIVHAGQKLYRTSLLDGDMTLYAVEGGEQLVLPDAPSEGFVSGECLYLLTGDGMYIVYPAAMGLGVNVSRAEEFGGVYVPTTTIGICAEDAEADSRESLDAVNLLTGRRMNRLILDGRGAGEPWGRYLLDAVPDGGTELTLEMHYTKEKAGTDGTVTVEDHVIYGKGSVQVGVNPNSPVYGKTYAHIYETDKNGNETMNDGQLFQLAVLDGGRLSVRTVLPEDTDSTRYRFEIENNCTVTFTHTVPGAAEKIGRCRFGAWFGENGTNWRLMISGNPDEPNVIRYSGSTGEAITDLTYWPDVNYISCGNRQNEITGFSRVSDGVMCAFKRESVTEPTIFYIQGTGTLDEVAMTGRQIFTVTAGSRGDGILSRRASADLNGTPLVLTRRGVCAVAIRQNITTAERYLMDVGRNIRQKLLSYGEAALSESYAFTADGRYYLMIADEAYFCDVDRVFKDEAGNRSFEWWHFDHFPARCHAILDGRHIFGTADGRICRMDTEGYADVTWESIRSGELNFGEGGVMAADERVDSLLTDGAEMVLDGQAFEAVLTQDDMTVTVDDDGRGAILTAASEPEVLEDGLTVFRVLERIHEGDEYELEQEGICNRMKMTVTDVDRGAGTVTVSCRGVWYPAERFRLLLSLEGERLTVRRTDEGAVPVRPGGDLQAVPVTENACVRSPEERRITGKIYERRPVRAEYWSGCIDLGTNLYAKTILRISAMTTPEAGGRFRFGYITARTERLIGQAGISGQTFDADFGDFTFVDLASSVTVRTNIRNFNYIVLRVESDEPVNAALAELTLLYKYNRINRGGV